MSRLRVETRSPTGSWNYIIDLRPTDPPGSLSHDHEGQREIIVFSCHGNYSIVVQSEGGIDIEEGIARTIYTLGRTVLARLGPNQQYERIIILNKRAKHIRWTHLP